MTVEPDSTPDAEPIDPDDPPSDVTELYVGAASTQRRYHVDPDCHRLTGDAHSRRVEIAAEWYPPCRFCVTDEFPQEAEPDPGGPPSGSEQPQCSNCTRWMAWTESADAADEGGEWECTRCPQ